jgi:hypothetical protein
MTEKKNSVVDIQKYLSTPDRPVKTAEFSDFWKSLTEAEKEEFKSADLPKA